MRPFLTLFLIAIVNMHVAVGQNSANEASDRNDNVISFQAGDGVSRSFFVAGPETSKAGIIFIHDFFGVSPVMRAAVKRLGALGYRTVGVDLYNGKSATTNAAAGKLMNAKKPDETAQTLKACLNTSAKTTKR